MKSRLLLFDIDGTLLTADGAGRRALVRSFAELEQDLSTIERIDLRGMTDRAIVRESLLASGKLADEPTIDLILGRYVALLVEELRQSQAARALPGVARLLSRLQGEPGIFLGLGTGNVAEGAAAKLRVAGLEGYFCFGGYGSDALVRGEVLRIGKERGQALAGSTDCDVVVIGDTRRDVEAALAIGAVPIGVETGGVTRAELLAAGAAHVFRDLEDPEAATLLLAKIDDLRND